MDADTVFETERLIARCWRLEDAHAAFAIYGDPEVTRHLGGRRPEPSVATQRDTLAVLIERYRGQPYGSWPLIEKVTGMLCGTVLLKTLPDVHRMPTEHIEIGWHLARRAWGRGFATEAGMGALKHGFDHIGLDRVVAVVESANVRSQAVARRLGMCSHGMTRHYYGGVELELFAITRAAWANRGDSPA